MMMKYNAAVQGKLLAYEKLQMDSTGAVNTTGSLYNNFFFFFPLLVDE